MLSMPKTIKTIEDAIDDKTTGTLNSVKRESDLNTIEAILIGWLIHLNQILDLKKR